MADQREGERESEREREKMKKIPKHVFIIIITYYGVLMIFNYYRREPYGLINRDQSNACARFGGPSPIIRPDPGRRRRRCRRRRRVRLGRTIIVSL